MPTYKVLLNIMIKTNNNEFVEFLLPLTLSNKVDLTELKSNIGKNIQAYYYKKNKARVEVFGKLKHIVNVQEESSEEKCKTNVPTRTSNPNVLEQIESVTSKEVAAILAKNYGGLKIYIPKTVKLNNPITQLIGREALEAIIREIGDGDLMIPASHYRCAGAKAPIIAELLKQGLSAKKIAMEVNCCERTVWLHKKKNKELSSLTE